MPAPTADEIAATLVRFVNADIMAPGHAIAPGDRFETAGVDSMALLKILLFVEREFGFWVPEQDQADHNVASATALARYVAAHLAAR